MIGWAEHEADVEMLRDAKNAIRLETAKLEVTVATQDALRKLAWLCVGEGFKVNLHSPTFITILGGKNEERVIEAKVRQDA